MLLARYAAGNEYAEVTDAFMDGVDDGLSVGSDIVDVLIKIENPSERLLGRRNAPREELINIRTVRMGTSGLEWKQVKDA